MPADGLKRIIASAKVQLLTSAAFGAVVTYLLTPGTPAEKRGLLETMVYALAALVGAVILGWAHEDASAKAAPTNQTNVNSDVRNVPAAPVVTPTPPVDPQQQLVEAVYAQVIHRLEARAQALAKARAAAATVPIDSPKGS